MTKEINNKFFMEADIELVEETEELRKEVSSVIKLPKGVEKQPDLQYFSALFVSSGTNLNKAHFMPSELVLAARTVPSKAVDVEHEEAEIIGHIYDYAFIDKEGNQLDMKELSSTEKASLDKQDMHIVIAGIIYKSRFPNIAKEVAEGKWKVSMEAYYQDYDVKVGDMILDRREAELLGFDTSKAGAFGSLVKVLKKGAELASGEAARVLRNICFTGVGIVKNPANPPSVVFETANKKHETEEDSDFMILDYDKITEMSKNNVTSKTVEDKSNDAKDLDSKEESEIVYNDTVGICVNYKKSVIDSTFQDEESAVVHENWCSLYETSCTSYSRDTTDPECLRNQAMFIVRASLNKMTEQKEATDKRNSLVDVLKDKLNKAAKFLD